MSKNHLCFNTAWLVDAHQWRRRSAPQRLCPISDVTSFLATCDNGFCRCDSARSPGDFPRARSHTHMLTAEKSTWRHNRERDQRLGINHTPTPRFRNKKIPTSDWFTVISTVMLKLKVSRTFCHTWVLLNVPSRSLYSNHLDRLG